MFANCYTPLYLHMLDRELRRSVSFCPDDDAMIRFVETAFMITLGKVYVGNSLLWENVALFPHAIKLILEMEKYEGIQLLSNYATMDEFIDSRRKLYQNDYRRYPMYFDDNVDNKPWGQHINFVPDSTTNWLNGQLFNWGGGQETKIIPYLGNADRLKAVQQSVIETLLKRDGKAITYSLFQHLGEEEKDKEYFIRRLISFLYTQRYMELMDGTILTGISGLSVFDQLSDTENIFDFELNEKILRYLNLVPCCKQSSIQELAAVLMILRSDQSYNLLLHEIRAFLQGIRSMSEKLNIVKSKVAQRNLMGNLIDEYLRVNKFENQQQSNIGDALHQIYYVNNQLRKDSSFKEAYDMAKSSDNIQKVLLVVATETELRNLVRVFKEYGYSNVPVILSNLIYLNFGKVGNVELCVLKTDMGSSGTGGVALAMRSVKEYINPDFVVSVGIAFGLNKDKQQLGDILVARQVKNYEPAKVIEGGEISRGDKMPANSTLLQRFSYSSAVWEKCDVHFGLVMSGEKLVNSEEFVMKLKSAEPEAIGGEMEGAGLMAACHVQQIPWVLVKAVCDWGYDKGDKHQNHASQNAIEFVYQTIVNYF
jgi:nucleoside phosphorylase